MGKLSSVPKSFRTASASVSDCSLAPCNFTSFQPSIITIKLSWPLEPTAVPSYVLGSTVRINGPIATKDAESTHVPPQEYWPPYLQEPPGRRYYFPVWGAVLLALCFCALLLFLAFLILKYRKKNLKPVFVGTANGAGYNPYDFGQDWQSGNRKHSIGRLTQEQINAVYQCWATGQPPSPQTSPETSATEISVVGASASDGARSAKFSTFLQYMSSLVPKAGERADAEKQTSAARQE